MAKLVLGTPASLALAATALFASSPVAAARHLAVLTSPPPPPVAPSTAYGTTAVRRYAIPPPPPAMTAGGPHCPLVPVRVSCQSPSVPCVRTVYRYVCRTRDPMGSAPLLRQRLRLPVVPPTLRCTRPLGVRASSSCRLAAPYHPKSTPYLGVGGGYLSLVRPTGGFEHLTALGQASVAFGWNLGGLFALELGLSSTFFRPEKALGEISRVAMVAVALDARLRLVRPSPHRPVVPFVQAGLGAYTLVGATETSCGSCKTRAMAHGGGLRAGGGLDLYLNRYMVLGTRVLYHRLFLSKLRGAHGQTYTDSRLTRLDGVSAAITLTTFWSHL